MCRGLRLSGRPPTHSTAQRLTQQPWTRLWTSQGQGPPNTPACPSSLKEREQDPVPTPQFTKSHSTEPRTPQLLKCKLYLKLFSEGVPTSQSPRGSECKLAGQPGTQLTINTDDQRPGVRAGLVIPGTGAEAGGSARRPAWAAAREASLGSPLKAGRAA